jgi:N-acetylmuramoyl-L-alanine amidase
MVPNDLFLGRIDWHEKQVLAAFDDPVAIRRFFMLEWHRRAHKTTLLINLLNRECCKYPKSKYVYVAPTQVWAREVVWDDPTMLWDALPDQAEMGWKPNEQKLLIKYANGSMLKIGGSDKPDSLRGIDADGVGLDEWALHKKETWTQIFRPIIAGPKKPGHRERWAMFLYTPKGPNHATMMFNIAACIESEAELPEDGKAKKHKQGWFASRLTADVSHIIPRAELDKMLEEVAEGIITQAEYDQEMQCKRLTDEERTLITSNMLDRLNTVNWDSLRITQPESRKIVAIDPAFGGDQCALKGFDNGRIVKEKQVNWTLTHEVVFEAKEMARQIKTKNFICDCIGNGKGVADGLAIDEAGYHVQRFNSAEKCEDSDRFANKKAEAVEYCAKQIRQLKVEPVKDPETRRQLVGLSRYKITNSGKMIMRSNDDTKKEIGCSPDRGLCYIYGIYGLRRVKPETRKETTYSGPMAV